jgi:hypothetical protein
MFFSIKSQAVGKAQSESIEKPNFQHQKSYLPNLSSKSQKYLVPTKTKSKILIFFGQKPNFMLSFCYA